MPMTYQRYGRRPIIPGMEPISMSFKNKKNNNNGNSDNDRIFKGRIFIADDYAFHDIYNSEKEKEYNQLYTELPPKNKRPRVEPILDLPGINDDDEDEQELPVMGPQPGVFMMEDFTLLVLDDNGPELQFSLNYSPPPCPGDFYWGKCNRAYWNFAHHSDKFNKLSVIKLDGDFGSLKLHCMTFKDSELLRVQVKWIPKQKPCAGTDDILICGEVTVSYPTIDGCKSFLLKTPPNKAIKVSAELPIPLLKSVVSFPHDTGLIISADLVTPPAFDDVNDSAPTVRGSVDFSKCLTEETSIFVSGFNCPGFEVQPSDEKDWLCKKEKYTCAFFCGSTKLIEGDGADLQVSIYMNINSSVYTEEEEVIH